MPESSLPEIGKIIAVNGEAFAESSSGMRPLEPGSPIYEGEELVTGPDGNLEVRFVDDTLLSQGGDSRISLDDYAFDPDGGTSEYFVDIAEGTFRMVTGKIAEQNPERFKVGSPLATIGIRGTTTVHEVLRGQGEKHGVEEIHAGKALIVQGIDGQIRQISQPQGIVDISSTGQLSTVRSFSPQELNTFQSIAGESIRQEQEIREDQRQQRDQDDEDVQDTDQDNADDNADAQDGDAENAEGDNAEGGEGQPAEGQGEGENGEGAAAGTAEEGQGGPGDGENQEPEGAAGQGSEGGQDAADGDGQQGGAALVAQGAEQNIGIGDGAELQAGTEADGQQGLPGDIDPGGGDAGGVIDPGVGVVSTSGKGTLSQEKDFDGSKVEGKPNQIGDTNQQGEGRAASSNGDDGNLDGAEGGGAENLETQTEEFIDTVEGSLNQGVQVPGAEVFTGNVADNTTTTTTERREILEENNEEQPQDSQTSPSDGDGDGGDSSGDDSGSPSTPSATVITGTNYDDTLNGTSGNNTIYGLGGNDVLDGAGGTDTLDGGEGVDLVRAAETTTGINVNLEAQTAVSSLGTATLVDIEGAVSTSFDDTFYGNDSNNTYEGGIGNDVIDGDDGVNTVSYKGAPEGVYVDLSSGTATKSGDNGIDTLSHINNVIGSTSSDSIFGDDYDNTFYDLESGGSTHDFYGGQGSFDTVSYEMLSSGSGVSISGSTATVGDAIDDFADIEAFRGSQYSDSFLGTSGNDTFAGYKGNDIIDGGAGDDALNGECGNDTIFSGTGNNSIDGGNDIDTLMYDTSSNVIIDAGAGTATVEGSAIPAEASESGGESDGPLSVSSASTYDSFINIESFKTGAGDDIFKGSSADETFDGGSGRDLISFADAEGSVRVDLSSTVAQNTGQGNDVILNIEDVAGSSYADTLTAGSGGSSMSGNAGNDVINGGAGDDVIDGGSGNDSISGGDGEDHIKSGQGSDTIDGGANDSDQLSYEDLSTSVTVNAAAGTASHSSGTDTFSNIEGFVGSSAGDTIIGQAGDEYIEGGAGNDVLDGGYSDHSSSESNWDTVSYKHASGGVQVDLGSGTSSGADGNDTLSNFERIDGSNYGDVLIGDSEANSFRARGGDDSIDGGGGNDTISYKSASGAVQVDLSAGTSSGADGNDTFTSIERIEGSTYDDVLTGDSGDNRIRGRAGNDTIDGGAGEDTVDYKHAAGGVYVNLGAGTATGGDGNDTLSNIENVRASQDYNDTIIGDSGNNYFTDLGTTDDTYDGSGGHDMVGYSDASSGVVVDMDAGTSSGGGGSDRLIDIDSAVGSTYADTLISGSGNSALVGLGGNDILIGGAGNDSIEGGEGNDQITGGGGENTLSGYTGNDTFNYVDLGGSTVTGETITDFTSADDTLNFSGTNYSSSSEFGTVSGSYDGSGAGLGTSPLFVHDGDGNFWYDENGSEAGGQHFIAGVAGTINKEDITVDGVTIGGGSGGSVITGTSGNDTLSGTSSAETINALAGDDTIAANGGNDTVNAGAGEDYIKSGQGSDIIDGGDGDWDIVSYEYLNDSVTVSAADGTVVHSSGTDSLSNVEGYVGSSSADTITGQAGDEYFEGGAGDDILDGGYSDHTTSADNYDTLSYKNASGGVQVDLSAGTSAGADGNDTLSNFERVFGSDYADTLIGSKDSDTFRGRGGDDSIDGGDGNDTVSYKNASGQVQVDLSAGTSTGADGNDTFTSIERITGSAYDDILTGDASSNRFRGQGGNDTIDGGDGTDTIDFKHAAGGVYVNLEDGTATGGDGNDTLISIENVRGSKNYNDTIIGDSGSNRFSDYGATDDTYDGNGGSDTVEYYAAGSGVVVDLNAGTSSGGGGNDTLIDIDSVSGSDYGDTITGDSSSTSFYYLYGGDGDDLLVGNGSDVGLEGGGGADTLVSGSGITRFNYNDLSAGGDVIQGFSSANDVFYFDGSVFSSSATFETVSSSYEGTASFGTSGPVFVYDTANKQLWYDTNGDSAGGNTLIATIDSGDDVSSSDIYVNDQTLIPNTGPTVITGTSSDDTLSGANNSNTIYGLEGDDMLSGHGGDDSIYGGDGYDVLYGGTGDDLLDGGADYDIAFYDNSFSSVTVNLSDGTSTGGLGNDTLANIESIYGSDYADSLIGNSGDNDFAGLGGDDSIDGGAGMDGVNYAGATAGVNVNLADGTATGGGGNDIFVNIEAINGSQYDDTLIGDAQDNFIYDFSGDDYIDGGAGADQIITVGSGNDTILGGAGDDFISPGSGSASIDGGIGRDSIEYLNDITSGVTVDLSAGTAVGSGFADTFASIENVYGSKYADTLTGDSEANLISGLSGDDVINGGGGDDTLYGSYGNDTINGGAGSNILHGDDGSQDLVSYEGNSSGIVMDTGAGRVTHSGGASVDTISNFEGYKGSANADSIIGSSSAERFLATLGDDTIDGGSGEDTISYEEASGAVTVDLGGGIATGAFGTDALTSIENAVGSDYADSLLGNSGENILEGGKGNDTIDGGAGVDTASYASAGGAVTASISDGTATGADGSDSLTNIDGFFGSAYDDNLTGDSNNNHFRGGAGDDVIDGGAGTDSVDYQNASAGVYVNLETGTASGGDGNDTLSNIENVKGSANYGDTIVGSSGDNLFSDRWLTDDTYDGNGGVDSIDYSSASSAVTVNLAAGTATGGGGSDILTNISGVVGTQYGDTLTASDSSSGSAIIGGSGDDVITGGAVGSVIQGGLGADSLIGGAGADAYLYNDISEVGDSISGFSNTADSFLFFGSFSSSSLFKDVTSTYDGSNGGIGSNGPAFIYDSTNGEFWYDSNGDDAGGNTLIASMSGGDNVLEENILVNGSALNPPSSTITGSDTSPDKLYGTSGANHIYGLGMNDDLFGMEGNDSLYGGSGEDVLGGGSGDDYIDGGTSSGDSDRLFYYDSPSGVTVDIAAGSATGGAGDDTFINIEGVIGSQYADTLTGDSGDNIFWGAEGNDSIDGGAGTDRIDYEMATGSVLVDLSAGTSFGADGNDVFSNIENVAGSAYNDLFYNSSVANEFDGAGGTDIVSYENSSAGIHADLSGATATVVESSGTDTLVDIEVVIGSNYADTLIGGSSNDTLDGLAGNDYLNGGDGNDYLKVGVGISSVDGGAGSDSLQFFDTDLVSLTIDMQNGTATGAGTSVSFTQIEAVIGGDAVDTITGMTSGAEIISGAGGADIISLSSGAGTALVYNSIAEGGDVITNFDSGVDSFAFSSGGGFASDAGFKADGTVSGSTDAYFVYDSGELYYDADGDGSGAQQLVADLNGDTVQQSDISIF